MKIALITGANKGIGFATARVLGEDGWTVLVGARDQERGMKAAAELGTRFVRLDVTDPATIEAAAALIDAEYGRLDLLINNAAINRGLPEELTTLPIADLREVYETNVLGVVAVTNAMLPLLRKSPAGRIANVSSGLGTFAYLTNPDEFGTLLAYNSSKAALNAVTLMYAHALRDTPITVNAVSPGFCATDLNNHLGVLTADEGGEHIARQATMADAPSGAFLSELGGTYSW
ncbi:SDR family NAD(P)-dependent oxidoreductase [Nonomuraea polychroma]|uniref:SDR family NAD(P)-dependent oxidoreductase n=1 Tax=Nonomuraea polychroma TaxID=46176 RepID=UPI003D8C725A